MAVLEEDRSSVPAVTGKPVTWSVRAGPAPRPPRVVVYTLAVETLSLPPPWGTVVAGLLSQGVRVSHPTHPGSPQSHLQERRWEHLGSWLPPRQTWASKDQNST